MLVELSGVQTALLVEGRTLVVVQVHGDVDRVAEEAAPQLGVPTLQHLGLSLQHGGEEISVAVLVLAPVLEVLEQRRELLVGVPLQVPVQNG